MGQLEDAAAGIQLAKDVAVRTMEGGEQEVLTLINSSTPGALAVAVAYMGGMLEQAFESLAGGDHDRGLMMLVSACGENQDTFDTQARILLEGEG